MLRLDWVAYCVIQDFRSSVRFQRRMLVSDLQQSTVTLYFNS